MRLRVADGFSHARSLAYAITLTFVQAIIGLIGLAVAVGNAGFSRLVARTVKAVVPGPGGDLLTQAVAQAHRAGAAHRYSGLVFGLVGALISGSTAAGQIERGLNRIYGVEQDRPTVKKYGLAFLLTVTAGTLTDRRLRPARVRPVDRRLDRQPRAEPRVADRAVAARNRPHDRRDHDALSLVAPAASTRAVVAGVRSGGRGHRVGSWSPRA